MIKFAVRRNLIYPLQLLLWNFLRDTESSLINHFFEVKGFLIYTFLMFLGEFLAGLIFYSLLRHYVKGHNKGDSEQFMNIKYIHNERYFSRRMDIKAYFLIFASSFSDFIQFTIFYELRKYGTISKSLEQRLRINFTLYNALFYYYVIKLPLFKHHIFSLITICICFFIIVITESFFQEFDIFLSYRQFAEALSIMLFIQFGNALIESIEKYLYEYYQLVPFYVLMFQGFFGSIITIIYYIIYSPFDEIIQFYKKRTTSEFIIQKRGGRGIVAYKASDTSGDIAGAALISDEDSILIIGNSKSICLSATDIPAFGRQAAGNIAIKDRIQSISKV